MVRLAGTNVDEGKRILAESGEAASVSVVTRWTAHPSATFLSSLKRCWYGCRGDDRRDRRPAGGGSCNLVTRQYEEATDCLYRWPSAPKGKRMGTAGAIISAFGESAQEKVEILSDAGFIILPTPSSFGEVVAGVLAETANAA